ncbi:prion-like-(Q/N-rich) domain-bearing protein 25 [Cephus cinctus]|uniref:Prion-like-(Q/N-rich) domain-bearing protein 25 n=1 Tax=Cephus cinctus TaxID=211228 RepID=A0AAJ7BG94_CEPCN|nr:prion-like-(Q/N-rich) domain-bearing protein 25 [Cephus cinctus]
MLHLSNYLVCLVIFFSVSLVQASTKSIAEQDAEVFSEIALRESNWECKSDSDCSATNSSCVNDRCSCNGGYIFNVAMTACLKIATSYGDECEETLQCTNYLLTGASCTDNICVCGDGYHYIHGRCYVTSGLFEECDSDVNCYVNADIEATSCVNGTCQCSDGFYQREYRTCRRGGYAVGDDCMIDNDCLFENAYCNSSNVCASTNAVATSTRRRRNTEYKLITARDDAVTGLGSDCTEDANCTAVVENSVCSSDSVCQCDIKFVENNGSCVPGIYVGVECTQDADCATIDNSRCGISGTCICKRAHFASTDLTSCVPELGESCTNDDTTSIGNSLCRNGTWSCISTSVFSTDNKFCRKTTKKYRWSCVYNEQCYIFGPNAVCQNKKCLCDEDSHLEQDDAFCWLNKGIGESCQNDKDCYIEGFHVDIYCRDSICSCPNGTHLSANGTACIDDVAELGGACESDSDCAIANSVCLDAACACAEYHYEVQGQCVGGINATCSTDADCNAKNSVCSSNLCTCNDGYVMYSMDTCIVVSNYEEECQYDIQCSTSMDNTVCRIVQDSESDNETITGTCTCDTDYHNRYGACLSKALLGDSCTSAGECYVDSGLDGVACLKGVCRCGWSYRQLDKTTCIYSDASTLFLSTSLGLTILLMKFVF